jgi:large repetitive protein
VVTANLLASSDSGASSTDGITRDNTPTFSGTVTGQYSELYLLINNVRYNITPAGNGSWTLTLPEMSDGIYNYAVVARDLSDNEVVVQKNIQIKTDIEFTTQLDNDTGIRNDDFLTNDNTLSFNGQTEPNNQIVATLFNAAGTVQLAQVEVTANQSGAYNLAFPNTLANGSYKVTFAVSDAAGNTFNLEETVVVDTASQPLAFQMNTVVDTGENTSDGITKESNVSFSGTGEAGSTVQLSLLNSLGQTIRTEVATVNTNGILTFQFNDLADGNYTVRATGTDSAGNAVTAPDYNFQVTTAAPVFTWSILEDGNNDAIVGESELNGGRLTFDGTGTAGHSITVLIAGQEYTTTVTSGGTWRITTPPLPDFKYPFQITAEDVAGNTTVVNSQVIQDSGLQVDVDLRTDSFHIEDNLTNVNKPIYRITTEANADVQFTLTGPNGYSYTTSFKQPSVVYDFTVPDTLADGAYSLTVRVTDQGLNVRTVTQGLVIDTVMQAQANIEVPNSTTDGSGIFKVSNSLVFIEGPTTADVDRVQVSINNGQLVEVDYNTIGNRFSIPFTLPNGLHNVKVTFIDGAGNQLVKNYQVDVKDGFATEPTVQIENFNLYGGIWYGNPNNLVLSGKAEPGLVMNIEIDGSTQTALVDGAGNWSLNLSNLGLADAPQVLSVSTSDQYGNQFSSDYTLILDSTPPTSTFVATSDLDPSVDKVLLNQKSTTIQGQAARFDRIEVKLNGAVVHQTTVGAGGLWSYNLQNLPEGQSNLLITFTDRAGNQSELAKTITVDTIAPTFSGGLSSASDSGGSASDGITKINNPQFSGTGEVGATIALTIGGQSYSATVGEEGTWSINVTTPLADGNQAYTITATDTAGNISATIGSSLTVDTSISGVGGLSAASDTGSSNSDRITKTTTPQFAGTGEVGATVTLQITGNSFSNTFTAVVDQTGNWFIDIQTPLAHGAYTYNVSIADAAGNSTAIASNQSLVIDTQISGTSAGLTDATDTGFSNTDFITNNNTPVFEGTGNEGDTVTLIFGGLPGQFTTTVDQTGQWTISLAGSPLADGDYTYTLQSTDKAGNQMDLVTNGYLKIDTQAAASTGASDITTSDTTPQFTGSVDTAEVGNRVDIKIDQTDETYSTWIDSAGNWSVEANNPVMVGDYTYDVTVIDTAGNIHTEEHDLKIV